MSLQDLYTRAPMTTLLLASFVGLFVLQIAMGVDIDQPDRQSLLHWGANFLPLTMSTQPWRLVSSAFLHIGLMHLMFNAFAMYYLGQVAERMMGSVKFLLLFLLSAIGGNLLNVYDSVYWQLLTGGIGLSAGASGGIMGIGGALLMFALFKVSVAGMALNLRSLLLIMGINLMYGFVVPGIDNAGHIGGALTGAVLALGIVYGLRYSNNRSFMNDSPLNAQAAATKTSAMHLVPWVLFCAITLLFCGLWLYLQQQLMPYFA